MASTPQPDLPWCSHCFGRITRRKYTKHQAYTAREYRDGYCRACGDEYCCNCNEHRDDHVIAPNINGNMKLTCLFNSTRWKSYTKKWKGEDARDAPK